MWAVEGLWAAPHLTGVPEAPSHRPEPRSSQEAVDDAVGRAEVEVAFELE